MTKKRENPGKASSTPKTRETYKQMKERHLAEERAKIRKALKDSDWYVGRVAKNEGMSYRSLQRTIDRLGLRDDLEENGHARGRPTQK